MKTEKTTNMEVIKTEFKDLYILRPKVFEDDRGYFLETFNQKVFKEKTGLDINFVQDNESESFRGVLRGLHYQNEPHAQSKLVRVIKGAVLDVVVDLRPESDMYGEYFSIVLDNIHQEQLFIPKGFAHGFITLSHKAVFAYKCDNYYNKESEGGIHPFDTRLNIDWLLTDTEVTLSKKDDILPKFKKMKI